MRAVHLAIPVLLPCVMLGLLAAYGASGPPQAPSSVGRYQVAAVGSRGPQRFATAFRMDTATGKTWRAIINAGLVDGWMEVQEPGGKPPSGGASEIGAYRIASELISDKLGQDTAVAARIDTRTGTTWYLRPLPAPPAWVLLENP